MEGGDRIRVLIVVPTLSFSSSARVALRGLQVLPDERYEKHLLSLRPATAEMLPETQAPGLHYHEMHHRSLFDPRLAAWIAALCRREAIDIVHTHGFRADLYGVLGARRAQVPVVLSTLHYQPSHYLPLTYGPVLGRWGARATRWILTRHADAIVALSETHREALAAEEGLPRERLLAVPFGIDTTRFAAACAARTAHEGIVAGTACNLTAVKHVLGLVEVAAELCSRWPQLRFRVAGRGPQRELIAQAVAAHGLQDRFELIGQVQDMVGFYGGLDVFLLASRSEATPQVVMEALAAGLPLVTTCAGGVPAMFDDGVEGFQVPIDDMAAFAARLERLVAAPDLRAQMATAAAALAEARYTLAAMAERLDGLYTRLLAQAGRGAS